MDHEDRTADTGMLGSDTENPGPDRDTRRTDPTQPLHMGVDDPVTTTAMSDADLTAPGSATHERGNARQ